MRIQPLGTHEVLGTAGTPSARQPLLPRVFVLTSWVQVLMENKGTNTSGATASSMGAMVLRASTPVPPA